MIVYVAVQSYEEDLLDLIEDVGILALIGESFTNEEDCLEFIKNNNQGCDSMITLFVNEGAKK